ncbi:hypothetical protein [Pseudomonas khavaziana]|uniref:Uncharacterized protein n=1 Tax=Pseudomonas khavaziana TaxID=2842351 RepID=A0ABZ2DDF2_9PSED
MAVKQVFETYVYDLGLSSIGQLPFVLMQVIARHGEACGGMPHRISGKMKFFVGASLLAKDISTPC